MDPYANSGRIYIPVTYYIDRKYISTLKYYTNNIRERKIMHYIIQSQIVMNNKFINFYNNDLKNHINTDL